MKPTRRKMLVALAVVPIGLLCLWWWQATFGNRSVILHVPQWIRGGTNASYYVLIGRGNAHPYGTIWKVEADTTFWLCEPWKRKSRAD